jgi:hypothetical protein
MRQAAFMPINNLKIFIMIKHLLQVACICMLFTFCNNASETANEKPANTVSAMHCYKYLDSANLITLKFTSANDTVSGTLAYDIYEKDKNVGTILGEMKGDMLIADYTFTSEGVKSVRQVVFKKSGSGFIGGMGDMEEKDGKMVYKNINALTFDPEIILAEVDCN